MAIFYQIAHFGINQYAFDNHGKTEWIGTYQQSFTSS